MNEYVLPVSMRKHHGGAEMMEMVELTPTCGPALSRWVLRWHFVSAGLFSKKEDGLMMNLSPGLCRKYKEFVLAGLNQALRSLGAKMVFCCGTGLSLLGF